MQPPFRSPAIDGFSLIELLVVISIVALLAGLSITTFNAIGQARGVTEAASQVSSAVELARSEAVSRQTYVWLSLKPETNSGSSDLRIGLVYSLDGTANTNATNFTPLGKPRLIERVTLSPTTASFKAGPGFTATPAPADLAAGGNGVGFMIGKVSFNGARTVTFTPLGEATTNPAATGFDPRIAIGLRQTRGTAVATNNDIAVVIDGSVGVPTTYQKTP